MSEKKYYITPEIAKVKIPRYGYWTIRDQQKGIIYASDTVEGKTFEELLDQIIKDNADPEISFKFGTSDGASRHGIALYMKVNEEMEMMPERKTRKKKQQKPD